MKLSKIASIFISGAILFSVGCGTTTDENSSTTKITGKVIDGAIYNAKVCVDYNFNQECDSNEPQAITDVNGSYTLKDVNLSQMAPVIVVAQFHKQYITANGGVIKASVPYYLINDTYDMTTKEKFNKKFAAPLDGEEININPITTLIGAKLYELKKENNLTNETVKNIEEELAKSLDINSSELITMDITKNPKIYALAVALASKFDTDLNNVNSKIDFTKLNSGLSEAIKDENLSKAVSDIMNYFNNINLDSESIQNGIEEAIKINDLSILKNPDELKSVSLKRVLTQNRIFKQLDDGLEINFLSDGNFSDFEEINNSIKELNGTWNIVNDTIILNYNNGFKVSINSFIKENPYVYNIEGVDGEGKNFLSRALLIPKNMDISQIPGITPLSESDVAGKSLILANENGLEDEFIFDVNGTYVENDEIEGKVQKDNNWSIKNGVLELSGISTTTSKPYTAKVVKFDKYLLALLNEDGIQRGFILNASFNNVNYNNTNEVPSVAIDTSKIASHKIVIDGLNPIYFTSEGKFFAFGEGTYQVVDNKIYFNDNGNEGIIYFTSLNGNQGTCVIDFKGEHIVKECELLEFVENNFDFYPSYVNNNQKIILDADDDFLNLDGLSNVQFNIKDDKGVGVQCTTNYKSFEDFKSAFITNNELILDATKNEIRCQYLNDLNGTKTQTEVIKFVNNEDGSYQVHMISGYFSGDDFNITAIDDDLLTIDGN